MWEGFIGRRSEPVTNWVERGAVRKFAQAIGDPNPLYTDEQVARLSRHGRLIAPPTFPVVFDHGTIEDLPLPSGGMMLGAQRFEYRRPLYVGEIVLCSIVVENAYEKRGSQGLLNFLVLSRVGADGEGAAIYSMHATLILTEAVKRGMGL
jgi:acyl dehydratase